MRKTLRKSARKNNHERGYGTIWSCGEVGSWGVLLGREKALITSQKRGRASILKRKIRQGGGSETGELQKLCVGWYRE